MKVCKKCQQPVESRCYPCERARKKELLSINPAKVEREKELLELRNERRKRFRSTSQGKEATKLENAKRQEKIKDWYQHKKDSDPDFLIKRYAYRREYSRTDKGKRLNREYKAQKRKEDIMFALKERLRCRVNICFKKNGWSKHAKTMLMLGAEWETVKAHIESLFQEGMTWDNRGEWHIDHIIPLASAKTPEEAEKLCHYSNLQPLWALDNLIKADSMPPAQVQ